MASAIRVMAYLQRARLASIRRGFSIPQLPLQHWITTTSHWLQRMDSMALENLNNGEIFLPFNELILSHNFTQWMHHLWFKLLMEIQ